RRVRTSASYAGATFRSRRRPTISLLSSCASAPIAATRRRWRQRRRGGGPCSRPCASESMPDSGAVFARPAEVEAFGAHACPEKVDAADGVHFVREVRAEERQRPGVGEVQVDAGAQQAVGGQEYA